MRHAPPRRLRCWAAGLFGVLTTLQANAPELSATVTALAAGHGDAGLGVIFGSNIFNLAAVLGLSPVVAGGVQISFRTSPRFLGGYSA